MPETMAYVLTKKARKAINKKRKEIVKWHAAMLTGDAAARRPGPLALGKDAFVGEMWKHIWKLDDNGVPTLAPMCGRAGEGQLRNEVLARLLGACGYNELLYFIKFGVITKANLEPQIVIMPNLLSLYNVTGGIDAVADEYAILAERGWYPSNGVSIPYLLWRCAPRGAVARKDGGPPRGIVDQGGPSTRSCSRYRSTSR